MRVVPRKLGPQIQFYEYHAAKWAADPGPIGVDPALAAQLQAETEAARAAFRAQLAALQTARTATQALRNAVKKMKRTGAGVIGLVRAKAATAGDGVYSLASLPVPNHRRSPLGPPGKPESITAELQQIGWLTLRWTCKNPRGSVGTLYNIYRRTEPNTPFRFIGVAGRCVFVDKTVPVGTGVVEYQLQAARTTAVGPVANYHVNLGVSHRSAPAAMTVAAAQLRPPRRSRKRRAA